MKVARLSALQTSRFYTPGDTPGTHLCYRPSQPQGHSVGGWIVSMKILVTPSEIKPAIFRLVAQWLHQLRHRMPPRIRA